MMVGGGKRGGKLASAAVSESPKWGTHTITASYVPAGVIPASAASLVQTLSSDEVVATQLPVVPVSNPAPALLVGYGFRIGLTNASGPVAKQTVVVTVQGFAPTTVTTDSSGNAMYVTPFTLSAGHYGVTAHYAGSTGLAGSDAVMVVEHIVADRTSLTLNAPATATVGATVTFTSVVTKLEGAAAVAGVGPANGTITLFDGGTAIATLTLTAVFTPKDGDLASSSAGPVTLIVLAPIFDLQVSVPTLTVRTEHHDSVMATVSSIAGFARAINLSCSVPDNVFLTCEVGGYEHPNSARMQLAANGTASVPVMIDTDQILEFKSSVAPQRLWEDRMARGVWAALLPMFGLGLTCRRSVRQRLGRGVWLGLVIVLAMGSGVMLTGCSSKYPQHTPVGSYDVVLSATGGQGTGMTVTRHLTLKVTP